MDDTTRTQVRLAILVILVFLPSVVLFRTASANLREHELDQQEDQLSRTATLAAVEYERLIDDSRALLAALAEFPEIRTGSGALCNQRLAGVLRHTPQFTTLSVIGPTGYMTCGSLQVEGDLYLGDRAYYLLATTRQRFSVGEYVVGRITGKPTVGVAYPIPEGTLTRVQNVLAASIDLSGLGAYTRPRDLPPHVTFTVLDRMGNVLVREPAGMSPLGYDTVGGRAPATFPPMPDGAGEPALVSGTDLDGVERRFALVALRADAGPSAGYVAVGKEEAMLLAETDATRRGELRLLAAAGLAVLVLAWLFGHYGLVRPVARAARSPGRG